MAPARHETPAGPPKENGTKASSTYGTRSAKRKSGDMSTNGDSQNASSSPSQKSAEASEPKLPPAKKRRSSSISIQQPVKTPESITPAEPESQSPVLPELPEIPEVTVDSPSGSSADEVPSPQKSVGWDEPLVIPEEPVIPQVVAPVTRGRGGWRGGRGRGRGGRGRGRGGRGGRGASALSGRSTPLVGSTPIAKGRGGMRGRGRGRGRARNIAPPVVRSLYDRRVDLKNQYFAIAEIQRTALNALSEKSLSMLMNDPKYHQTLPQYETVSNRLKQNYEQHLAKLRQEFDRKVAYLSVQRDSDDDYERVKLLKFVEETLDLYETRVKEHALYIYHQGTTGYELDEIPFAGGEDGRVIKILDPVEQIVPDVALGPFAQPTKADPAAPILKGDNYFEQHPAHWWNAKTPEERKQWEADWKKRKAEKIKRDLASRGRGNKPKLSAMENTTATASKDDDQEQSPDSSADEGDANSGSPKATGASAAAAAAEPYDDDDAPAQPLDTYGFSVPRLSAKHNNRIVGPPPVKFSEDEIGNRITKSKKDNPNHRYGQTPANPKKFHVDQNIRQCNAAKNAPEDLDQALVEKHKLHPKMGLPMPDSLNPDEPVNDWKAPLKETHPVTFIQNPRPGTERARELLRTTRSQWVAKADQDFDVDVVEKMHMRGLLTLSGDLEVPPEEPVEPEVPEVPQVIDSTLINAVDRAEALRQEEARNAAVAAHHAQFSPPPPPARVNPPTPQRYDPVRDRTYRTPYAPMPHPRGQLDHLAEAASIHETIPPPPTYQMPPTPYGMPQLLPAPAPPVYQSMYGPPPQQYQSQRPAPAPAPAPVPVPAQVSGRHRELRPAPPQNRGPPPPPPPPRGWWN